MSAGQRMTLQDLCNYAAELLFKYNLDDWALGFNQRKMSFGLCRFRQKRIELSLQFALKGKTEDILDTIKHEVAHAIVGPGHAHDDVWMMAAVRVGAKPSACASGVEMPDKWRGAKYVAACTCGVAHIKYRKPKRMYGWKCRAANKEITWKPC